MPLTINVGLNRKASKDYQSTGASINLTAELDQSLLTRPNELQGAVSELYEQAELALDRQVGGGPREAPPRRTSQRQNGSNGHGRSNGQAQNGRGMTQSQCKAIHAIADQLGVDAADEARHEFGIDLDRASIAEASKLIDHLKSLQGSASQGSSR